MFDHVTIRVADLAASDRFSGTVHRGALEAGYRDPGAPGERPLRRPGSRAASVPDPDGLDVEPVAHHRS